MVEPFLRRGYLVNHRDYFKKGNLVTSSETEVFTEDGSQIPYDFLVIATGHKEPVTKTRTERVDHYKAEHEKIKSASSILIVGGGPTGLELAGEIAVDFPEKKVTQVHRGTRLLEFIGHKASSKALKWLKSKKVEVKLEQSVNLDSVSNNAYQTSGGETIEADVHFLCTGKPLSSAWLRETTLKDHLDSEGRIQVDQNLRVKGRNNIFVIGDITDVPEFKQGANAAEHAQVVAKNLRVSIGEGKDKKLGEYRAKPAIAIVSLGRKRGLAQFPFMTVLGRFPGLIKTGDLFVSKTRKELGLETK